MSDTNTNTNDADESVKESLVRSAAASSTPSPPMPIAQFESGLSDAEKAGDEPFAAQGYIVTATPGHPDSDYRFENPMDGTTFTTPSTVDIPHATDGPPGAGDTAPDTTDADTGLTQRDWAQWTDDRVLDPGEALADIMAGRYGPSNGITSGELSQKLDDLDSLDSTPRTRALIREDLIRDRGMPVAADTTNGYYLVASPDQLDTAVERLNDRIEGIKQRRENLIDAYYGDSGAEPGDEPDADAERDTDE